MNPSATARALPDGTAVCGYDVGQLSGQVDVITTGTIRVQVCFGVLH